MSTATTEDFVEERMTMEDRTNVSNVPPLFELNFGSLRLE